MTYNQYIRNSKIRQYKQLKTQSERGEYIKLCLDLLTKIVKKEKGAKCQLCGKAENQVPFGLCLHHILSRQAHPRLILYRPNLLLVCWSPFYYQNFCHNIIHHKTEDDARKQAIMQKMKKILGEDYRNKLLIAERGQPKQNLFQLKSTYEALKVEHEEGISEDKE